LAYWVLTGRHAYEARTLEQLPEAWHTTPRPPSDRVGVKAGAQPIPPALDELVMAMLSQNPLARPASAAEVIARLSTIARLPPDDEPLSAMSYLQGGKSVGRVRERAKLRRRMRRALSGGGSLVLLEGQAGMGCARILGELAIEARLTGATAIVIDAALHQGVYSLAEQISRALLAAQPEKARTALVGHEAVLARFTTRDERISTHRLTAMTERAAGDPRETRLRTQGALMAWIERLVREVPLSIAVHNFQRADESSAALLAALTRGISEARLFVALAYDPDDLAAAPGSLEGLREDIAPVVLRGLNRDEVRVLVESTFGAVPNTERLASWLYDLTGGNPQRCLDLMHHLLEQRVIRFIDGLWTLPHEVSPAELPSDLNEMAEARLDRLSPDALRLCLALGVHRGPASVERCVNIAEFEHIAEPLRALHELEATGVIVWGEESVRFVHAAARDAALRRIGAAELRRLHGQLGKLLSQESGHDVEAMLDAGWHLLHGGEERRGADVLAGAALALSYDANGMPAAIPALRAALTAFRKQGRGKHELARLLGPLAMSGFYTDRLILEEYGDGALEVLQDVVGLSLARRLRPWLGRTLGTWLGLAVGFGSCVIAYGPRKAVSSFTELVVLFQWVATVLVALGTITLDPPRARRYARLMEPLTILGTDSGASLGYRMANALARVSEDRIRESLAECRAVLARLDDPRPVSNMPDDARKLAHGTVLYTCGSLLSLCEDPDCLKMAERLDGLGLKLYEMFANQIRTSYHGLRGEIALADSYRRRVELFAVQAGSSWQAELWTPCVEILCFMLSRDVVGLKRVASQLQRLSREVPSMRRHSDLAQAAYHLVQGEHEASAALGRPIIKQSDPRSFIGWSPTLAGEILNTAALGDPEGGRQLGLKVLSLYSAEDLKATSMVVPIVVALARVEAELGDLIGAAARLDAFLAELGEGGGPVTRGALHEARAHVAMLADDALTARLHVSLAVSCFTPTENPALVARGERLQRKLDAETGASARSSDTLDLGAPGRIQIINLLRACATRAERFDRALQLLLEQTGGPSGYAFGLEGSGLTLLARRNVGEPDALLVERLRVELRSHIDADERSETASSMTDSRVDDASGPGDGSLQQSYILELQTQGASAVVAVAVIDIGDRRLRAPPAAFMSALAEGLHATDVPAA
jgi:hypothetical protein